MNNDKYQQAVHRRQQQMIMDKLRREGKEEEMAVGQSHLVKNYYSIDVMQLLSDGLYYAVVTNVLEGDRKYLVGHGYSEQSGAIQFAQTIKFDFEDDWEILKHKTDLAQSDFEANKEDFMAWARLKGFLPPEGK